MHEELLHLIKGYLTGGSNKFQLEEFKSHFVDSMGFSNSSLFPLY